MTGDRETTTHFEARVARFDRRDDEMTLTCRPQELYLLGSDASAGQRLAGAAIRLARLGF